MTSEKALRAARMVSVAAATIISLACGTNYVYSAWAPQFAAKLKLSSTQSNLIGVFGNLGMYASGIPVGLLVDAKGPRPGVLLGSVGLGTGYFAMHRAYDAGEGSVAMPFLCLFAFLTGSGSAAAFSGSIKTSALNWPNHRGTATAFPLSAFGLSAFFFSTLSSLAFPDDTSHFLLLLSIGTFSMAFISSFFLRVIPHSQNYSAIPTHEERGRSHSNPLHRTKSTDSKRSSARLATESGRQPTTSQDPNSYHDDTSKDTTLFRKAHEVPNADTDETSSLMSKSSTSMPGDVQESGVKSDTTGHDSHGLDIRGLALLPRVEFWQLFLLLGLLTGIGLMTINNIGNDAQALWSHYDDSATPGWIQRRQLVHVSILSLMSFTGRLCSGVGSDLIVKKFGMSRFWCLFTSSSIFCAAQVCGARIENPNYLGFVSGLTGLAYGFLFGVYPSLVAETFGVHGLSQNWGCMTLAPVISGNIFNLIYGSVYDHHSTISPEGRRDCPEGLHCYNTAYWVTFGASLAGVGISLWSIRHDHVMKSRARKKLAMDEGREV
ncbi:hypothetical protein MMC24_004289 [Lignoscripta atroalba]|nr:hypothetical protein [Lignoscripta atroalba]